MVTRTAERGAGIRVETIPLTEADVAAFAGSIRGEVIGSDAPHYDQARRVWNGMIDKYPALIARCMSTADVVTAVQFARAHDLLVAVRAAATTWLATPSTMAVW